jgi:hypothetical protein
VCVLWAGALLEVARGGEAVVLEDPDVAQRDAPLRAHLLSRPTMSRSAHAHGASA